MGEVALTLQVMPKGKEVDMEELRDKVNDLIEPNSIEEEPVAFGLNSLKVVKVVADDAGGSDEVEEELMKIEEVNNVKVLDQRKLL
ncbi:hypothetical protein AKJ65_00865 [candidate division MSBL1 archaeon SCGC-AAA259E19]|uniref:Elongation factor 1-beta n=1 Tax=candidate division MSBL1 archaeon SCGC-AAA259E19 TaxID=1698264 RepID=A0A133UNE3_9EURY|nr:hypothetical protein AKJ65_00865 [candidate division MSBL1 archaeon SCGC-AAA259E19]